MNELKSFAYTCMLLIFSLSVHAQMGQIRACEKIDDFKKTTTLIVLDNQKNTAYNQKIQKIIDSYWRLTPVKYIPEDSLKNYFGNSEYSMLVRNNSKRMVRRGGGRTATIQNNDLAIYICDQGPLENYLGGDAIASVDLAEVMRVDDYLYKLGGLIQGMQSYVDFLESEKIDRNTYEKEIKRFEIERVGDLANLTLLVCADDLSAKTNNPEKLIKSYGYPVEIVSKERIEEALDNEEGNIVYMHLHPRQREFFLIQAAGGRVLYHALVNTYGELKMKDFAILKGRIAKANKE